MKCKILDSIRNGAINFMEYLDDVHVVISGILTQKKWPKISDKKLYQYWLD